MRPHYLDVDGIATYAVLHEPDGRRRDTAVIVVPPLGFDDTASYRTRHAWAEGLAAAGFPVLRLDLPGTGDSGGSPADPGRVDAWRRALVVAATELRAATGASRVAALGFGFGGLLAVVTAPDAGIDELVLWGAPSRGRSVVRELRAFASLEASRSVDPTPLAKGTFTVNGFLITGDTADAIGALDARGVPAGAVRRALLIERDGLSIDDALRVALAESGADVTVAAGAGYGQMMSEPQRSLPPRDVMSAVTSWLSAGAGDAAAPPLATPALATEAAIVTDGAPLRERLVDIETPDGRLAAVLTEPAGPTGQLTAVLLNAGATRRAGPNRMWVEAARRWAAAGVPTLRVDLAGLGDSGGVDRFPFETEELYLPGYRDQVTRILDRLGDEGYPQRFVLMGLCSGAYWSFQIGQVDDRVAGIILLNPLALVFDPFAEVVRESRELRQLLRWQKWVSIARGQVTRKNAIAVARAAARRVAAAPKRVPERLATRRRARAAGGDDLDFQLDRLRDNGVDAYLVFSRDEPLHEELTRDGRFTKLARWPNLRLDVLDGPPDTHTLQTIELQERAHAIADTAVKELLAREAARAVR